MEETPSDQKRNDLRLAGARRHFQDISRPLLVEHPGGDGSGGVEAEQIEFVTGAAHLVQPNDRLHSLALGEIVAKRRERTVSGFEQMFGVEPPHQECFRGGRGALVPTASPVEYLSANLRDEWGKELFVGGAAKGFVRRKPALLRQEGRVG